MSIGLPRHLSAWEPQLRIFAPEIALALGPMVQKLAALVGPFAGRHSEGALVPDGFAGLSKRGAYERLIASDWLLADELPQEFMRRSVMGEHLFWKLAYLEPVQSRSSLVLFDAGPEQLGSPRLAHLAALAVFEARARAAHANFGWSVLQSSGDKLLPGMNSAEVETLLAARGNISARPENIAFWLQRAAESGGGEIWFVGSERLLRFLPETVSSLTVRDVIQPGERRLVVDCRPAGKHTRTIELELPAPEICARLMRDPFALATAPVSPLDLRPRMESLLLSSSGNQLYSVTAEGDIMALSVPNSPRGRAGTPRVFSSLSQREFVAIGETRKTAWLVSFDPDSMLLHLEQSGRPQSPVSGEYRPVNDKQMPVFLREKLRFCVWHSGSPPGLYLLDDAGLLIHFFEKDGERRWVGFAPVMALAQSTAGAFWAMWNPVGTVSIAQTFRLLEKLEAAACPKVLFGHGTRLDHPVYGLIALSCDERHWRIHNGRAQGEVEIPEGFTVWGVVRDEDYEETLIVVQDDHRTLSLVGAHGVRPLVRASSRIITVSGCQRRPFIAYVTENEDLHVFSLKHLKDVLYCQWRPE